MSLTMNRQHQYLYTVDVRGEIKDPTTGRVTVTWTRTQAQGDNLWDVLTVLKLDYLDQIRYVHKEIIR